MALKKMNTEFQKLEKGAVAEGFLISRGEQLFAPKIPGGDPSIVPTLVLAKPNGDKFKVILGTTVRDDVHLLALNVWTVIKKAKESKATRSGNNVIEYDLLQDAEKVMGV